MRDLRPYGRGGLAGRRIDPGGFKSLCRHHPLVVGLVGVLFAAVSLPVAAAGAEPPDDPALARDLSPPPVELAARADPGAASIGPWRFSATFGWASPVIDPLLREGFGGGAAIAYGRSLAAELRSSFGYNKYEDPLDNAGVPFASGDVTAGACLPLLLRRTGRLDVYLGAGPAWMTGILGWTWSLGAVGGLGGEILLMREFGFRFEASYHLFHLTEIGGPTFKDRNSFRKVGPVDRFDLVGGLVFHL